MVTCEAMATDSLPPTRYKHDCDRCIYLGRWDEYDLYFCADDLLGPTVVARYSSHGPDYASGLRVAAMIPELAEARTRAIAAGLLTSDMGEV